jgi:superfamily II DNA/RNA helicase
VDFEFLGLAPETLRAVEEAGYKQPTPIQAQAIPSVLQGRDVLGIAQTGTGKTASFTLPMIDVLSQGRTRARMPRSLILEPTRELAAQVAQNFETYGKYHKLNMALLIGGVSFDDQERKLDRGVDVLIATPGRLLDHFERGKLMMTGVEILVIDEADRMLDMGFIPDVERICSLITKKHQTLFFSATMPREIQNLVSKFLTDPKRIEVAPPTSTAANVEQFLVPVPSGEAGAKRAKLRDLIRQEDIKNAIVFCNRKRDVDVVYRSLKKHGFNAAALHGDMDQGSRMDVLDKFKAGTVQLLIASDVAARGLDIPSMSHVFNFDVPSHAEDYIHRIGRTGRAGRSGRTFMLSTKAEAKWLRNVENLIGKPISLLPGATADTKTDTKAAPAEAEDVKVEAETGTGSRRGRRRRKNDRGGAGQAQQVERNETRAEPVDDGADKQQPERTEEPMRNRDQNQQRGRSGRRRGRDDRGRDDDFEPVVGLGDHVPDFLLRDVNLSGTEDLDALDGEDESDADIPAVAEEPKPAKRAKTAKSSRSRAKKAAAKPASPPETAEQPAVQSEQAEPAAVAPVEETPVEAATSPESAPEEQAVAPEIPAAEEKPKAKRARKPRAKKATAVKAETEAATPAEAEPVAETTEAAAEAPAEKPTAKRAKRASTAKKAATAKKPAAKRASTAKRATAKKPAAGTEAASAPAEDDGETPKPRAKRTRRKASENPA